MSYMVGQRIRTIRQSNGLSMEEFGKILGTSKGAVNNWEKGQNLPNTNRLKKIAELGNTTVDELLKSNFLTCHNCKYNLIKNGYQYCPICGTKLTKER